MLIINGTEICYMVDCKHSKSANVNRTGRIIFAVSGRHYGTATESKESELSTPNS